MSIKNITARCGCTITYVSRYDGMYCNNYCCNHCPDATASPCQKEKKEGSVLENLYKLQHES